MLQLHPRSDIHLSEFCFFVCKAKMPLSKNILRITGENVYEKHFINRKQVYKILINIIWGKM